MAREGITAAQVTQAADALVGEGKQPTISGVRDWLGGGSPNTVYRHLAAWRETRPQTVAAAPSVPASLTASIAAEIGRATVKARAEIEGRLVQVGKVLEVEREALTEQVAALTRERDTLASKAAHFTKKYGEEAGGEIFPKAMYRLIPIQDDEPKHIH